MASTRKPAVRRQWIAPQADTLAIGQAQAGFVPNFPEGLGKGA